MERVKQVREKLGPGSCIIKDDDPRVYQQEKLQLSIQALCDMLHDDLSCQLSGTDCQWPT